MRQIIAGTLGLLEHLDEVTPGVKYIWYDGEKWNINEDSYHRLFCALGNAGVDGIRLLSWTVWGPRPYGIRSQFAPYVLESDRFNLSKFNDHYFPFAKKVISIARRYGLRTWFVLVDSCQFHGPAPGLPGSYSRWSPWVTNTNGISTVYCDKAVPFIKNFVDRVVEEFRDINPSYCFGNECNKEFFVSLVEKAIVPHLKAGRIDPYRSTYGATMSSRNWVYKNGKWQYDAGAGTQDVLKKRIGALCGDKIKLAIWKEVHRIGEVPPETQPPHNLHQALTWWARKINNGIRIWLADDGVHPRPNASRWVEVINKCKTYGNDFTFEHCPEDTLEEALGVFRAIYRALHGKEPEEKYHYNPPMPPPPLPPDTVDVEVCETSNLLPTEWCKSRVINTYEVGKQPIVYCGVHKMPCSEFLRRLNIWGWLRCIFLGKH